MLFTAFALFLLISSALSQRDALVSQSGPVRSNDVDNSLKLRSKRSDIDSRLMELQAKIDIVKAFQNLPAGHGKFDFDKIGKRYLDPVKYMKYTQESIKK